MNLVLVSSVINISNRPLSYTTTRSVFSRADRFSQTLDTIKSVNKIPNPYVVLLEGSILNIEQEERIKTLVDVYINVYIVSNNNIRKKINGSYKSISEGTLLHEGVKSIDINLYDSIFKISGRYALDDRFDLNNWAEDQTMFWTDGNSYSTTFYKISKQDFPEYINTLYDASHNSDMIESTFKKHFRHAKIIQEIGLTGRVGVDGSLFSI